MSSVRSAFVAVGAVAVGALGPGLALAAEPEPLPVDDLSRFESAPVPGLSLAVERDDQRLRPGRDTTYTITVRNGGEAPESVTIRVSVPPTMAEVAPDEDGEVGDGVVEWPVTVPPHTPATLHLTGAYADPDTQLRAGGPVRVALTACALGEDDRQPIVCATDLAQLDPPASGTRWWLLAGAATTILAAVAVFLLRRRRRAVT